MNILEPIKASKTSITYSLVTGDKVMTKEVPRTQAGFREINAWAAQFGRFRHN